MIAAVKIGGSQYLVEPQKKYKVDRLVVGEGEVLKFGEVLLAADDKKVVVGKPFVKGASVSAKVLAHGRGDKVIVFKYKSKTRYRVKRGFRPQYTEILVEAIKL